MAAAVSGFLEFAISKVVDQFWTPISGRDDEPQQDVVEVAVAGPVEQPEEPVKSVATKPKQLNQKARRAARRKAAVAAKPPLEIDVKPRAYSDADPAECSSNASTCGSSDDEDDVEVDEAEDIGAKEMRLMLERAQEIKRLAKQSRQQRPALSRAKSQPLKTKQEPRVPDVRSPIRLQNVTHELWNWSVYSGFAVDTKVSNRGPRCMRNIFCALGEKEKLEDEDRFLDLAAQVLADN